MSRKTHLINYLVCHLLLTFQHKCELLFLCRHPNASSVSDGHIFVEFTLWWDLLMVLKGMNDACLLGC